MHKRLSIKCLSLLNAYHRIPHHLYFNMYFLWKYAPNWAIVRTMRSTKNNAKAGGISLDPIQRRSWTHRLLLIRNINSATKAPSRGIMGFNSVVNQAHWSDIIDQQISIYFTPCREGRKGSSNTNGFFTHQRPGTRNSQGWAWHSEQSLWKTPYFLSTSCFFLMPQSFSLVVQLFSIIKKADNKSLHFANRHCGQFLYLK